MWWKDQSGYKVTRAYIKTHKFVPIIESSFLGSTPNEHILTIQTALKFGEMSE
jgi:hypothetical protein